MSLSFVESHVWVGVLSFVSVRFISTVISCSRLPPDVRILFPKFSCLLLKSPVKYDVAHHPPPLQTEPLNDFSLGQYNLEMCNVPGLYRNC